MEYQTFSEVTVEYSEVLKALFRPFKLDSIPELRWNSHILLSAESFLVERFSLGEDAATSRNKEKNLFIKAVKYLHYFK